MGLFGKKKNENSAFKSMEEITQRIYGLLAVSLYASSQLNGSTEIPAADARGFVREIFKREFDVNQVEELLSPAETAYFLDDNAETDIKIYYAMHYECLWALEWTLDLVEWTEPADACDARWVSAQVRSRGNMKKFSAKTALRRTDEIQEKVNLIAQCAEEIQANPDASDKSKTAVVMLRQKAFDWLTKNGKTWDDCSNEFDRKFIN